MPEAKRFELRTEARVGGHGVAFAHQAFRDSGTNRLSRVDLIFLRNFSTIVLLRVV